MKKILLFVAGLMLAMTASAEITLYYVNSGNWASVNAYVWPTGGNGIVGWPGAEATATGEKAKGFDVYSYTFDETLADNVIFNDGSAQTGDMSFDASKPYCYGEQWYASIAEIEGAGDIQTYDYYIAGAKVDGTDWVCGKNWNPAGCGLANNTVTYENLPAGNYIFKVTDGSWVTTWGFDNLATPSDMFTRQDTDNIQITLASAATVTISFDGSSISITVVGGEGEGGEEGGDQGGEEGGEEGGDDPIDTPTAAGYYLVGYINGANYGCEEDYLNPGEYKFVDGSLTATFDADSYVFIKTGDNAKWYLFETYCTETSGVLIENKSEKMLVPGGQELTFTLVENGDGSLTLSYTTGTTTDLEDVDAEDAVVAAYDLIGRPVAADAKGLVILQYASGKAVKVYNN